MRRTVRLLASVKAPRFLEPGTPTGLTGLLTHPAPRPTLIYLYSSTLEKLKALPSSSLYRQSTEALTNHRLNIIQSTIPEGLEEWKARSKSRIEAHPEIFDPSHPKYTGDLHKSITRNGISFIETRIDGRTRSEMDRDDDRQFLEGTRTAAERKDQDQIFDERPITNLNKVPWEPEPPLTADQYVHSASFKELLLTCVQNLRC